MVIRVIIIWFSLLFEPMMAENAVTFVRNGGRLGDDLLSFASALWFSYLYDVPLLVNPFDYANQLMLDELPHYDQSSEKKFKRIVQYTKNFSFDFYKNKNNILFQTSFYNRPKLNMKDPIFREKMRSLITPNKKLNLLELPSDCVTVALHVRTGGGFAMDEALHTKYPLRFVPLHFYADQLKVVLREYPGEQLYVFLFTDDQHPEQIIEYLRSNVANPLITFDTRTGKNRHNLNVLEDFFSMMQFQVFIRPVSNFSKMAEYLGNFDLVFVPTSVKWVSKTEWVIDGVKVIRR